MSIYYDFHIHTSLSPCADNDMTPNNIVNMALLKGLDVIAITDHNSIGNVAPTMQVGKREGLVVIPGIEVQTAEEVHIICLFPSLEVIEEIADLVYKNLPEIRNREDIFGEQLLLDSYDNVIGKEKKLLVNSSSITINQLYNAVKQMGGAFIPAHINRSSFSILSNLGFIPDNFLIKTIELSQNTPKHIFDKYKKYQIIVNSDAHNLGEISECKYKIEISNNYGNNILKKLCNFL
jgi:PHP family Zn ribbon phosphoesterase